jgi:hypothetical protein
MVHHQFARVGKKPVAILVKVLGKQFHIARVRGISPAVEPEEDLTTAAIGKNPWTILVGIGGANPQRRTWVGGPLCPGGKRKQEQEGVNEFHKDRRNVAPKDTVLLRWMVLQLWVD